MESLFGVFKFLFLLITAGVGIFTFLYIQQIIAEEKNNYTDFKGFIITNLDFFDSINKEIDPKRKRFFKRIASIQIIAIVCSIGIALTFLYDIRSNPCQTYQEYLLSEFQGEIVGKYMDKPNHNLGTLTIEFEGKTKNDNVLSLNNIGLYDAAQIGDLLIKLSGDSIVYLNHSDKRIDQFKINKSHYCLDKDD
ncbi:hypothetical protein [Algoriphagus antarcticus]|uniref:Transmembrane protein n=1 Tax=Algoriphagus antarcticus TaxID=238540 RepID=A0A3E0E2V6_9BACT|nr:hypothetical protein [Algoriphagus antarcticus]REG92063.1 hypothetical protein C8N25_103140 [Algoriphagus antarcticus]